MNAGSTIHVFSFADLEKRYRITLVCRVQFRHQNTVNVAFHSRSVSVPTHRSALPRLHAAVAHGIAKRRPELIGRYLILLDIRRRTHSLPLEKMAPCGTRSIPSRVRWRLTGSPEVHRQRARGTTMQHKAARRSAPIPRPFASHAREIPYRAAPSSRGSFAQALAVASAGRRCRASATETAG